MPAAPPVTLRPLAGHPDEVAAIQSLFESAPIYFERIAGGPAGPTEALGTFSDLPPGSSRDNKHVLAIVSEGEIVGCIDVVRGFPDPATAMLGLLLVGEPWQGRGVGAAAYRALESLVAGWDGCRCVRIGVVRTNGAVLAFWRRLGFVETGEVKPYARGPVASEIVVLSKPLP